MNALRDSKDWIPRTSAEQIDVAAGFVQIIAGFPTMSLFQIERVVSLVAYVYDVPFVLVEMLPIDEVNRLLVQFGEMINTDSDTQGFYQQTEDLLNRREARRDE